MCVAWWKRSREWVMVLIATVIVVPHNLHLVLRAPFKSQDGSSLSTGSTVAYIPHPIVPLPCTENYSVDRITLRLTVLVRLVMDNVVGITSLSTIGLESVLNFLTDIFNYQGIRRVWEILRVPR